MNLITGGTGLVGTHIIMHLLNLNEEVKALYKNEKSIEKTKLFFKDNNKLDLFNKINWVFGDVIDIPSLTDAFVDVKYVYHCAALISFDPNDEESLRKVNIEGTANMVNLSLSNTVEKFCFISSIAALGDLPANETVITEKTEWNPEKPHSDYALSKHGAEMEVWRGLQEGLNCFIVNPGVILGSGFWNTGSGKIFKKVANGNSFYTLGSTGFVTVDDVVKATYTIMKSNDSGEKYILVAENLIYKDVLIWVADALNAKKPTIYARPFFTEIVWRLDLVLNKLFLFKRSMSRPMAKSLHSKDTYSNLLIIERHNFKFSSVKESIYKIAKNYK